MFQEFHVFFLEHVFTTTTCFFFSFFPGVWNQCIFWNPWSWVSWRVPLIFTSPGTLRQALRISLPDDVDILRMKKLVSCVFFDKQSLAWEIRWQFSHRMLGAKTVPITQSYLLRLSAEVWPRPKLRPELDIYRPMAVQVETNSGS